MEIITENKTGKIFSDKWNLIDSEERRRNGWMYGILGSVGYKEISEKEGDGPESVKVRKVELSFLVEDKGSRFYKNVSITHGTVHDPTGIVYFDPKAEEIREFYLSQPEEVRRTIEGLPEKVKGLIRLAVPEIK